MHLQPSDGAAEPAAAETATGFKKKIRLDAPHKPQGADNGPLTAVPRGLQVDLKQRLILQKESRIHSERLRIIAAVRVGSTVMWSTRHRIAIAHFDQIQYSCASLSDGRWSDDAT